MKKNVSDDDMKTVNDEKDITDLMIKQCSDPIIDFEFGDVQEILVELSKTNIIEESPEEELKDSVSEGEQHVPQNEEIDPSIHHEIKDCIETEIDQTIPTEETDIIVENTANLENRDIKSVFKSSNAKKKSKKKKQSLKTMSSQIEENPNNQEGMLIQDW